MKQFYLLGLAAIALSSCYRSSVCQCTTTNLISNDVNVDNRIVEGLLGLGGGKKARKQKCTAFEHSDNYTETKCQLIQD